MNWVGGSRSRCMLKNDTRKQREFFEKKKMQKKIEHLGLATDPQGAATGSIDLVTLFIVNQIAANKENKNSHKVTHLSQRKGARWSVYENTLELPMSPCSPSGLCLMESQPQYSVQRKRKHHLPELSSSRQLSPVLESNFSDCSASDYRHVISDTFSPLSSGTSGSLSGSFPVGQRGEFRPFCQPREMRGASPWSAMSHGSQLKDHFPSVQFSGTESSTQKSRGHTLETTGCFLSLSKDKEKDRDTGLVDFNNAEYTGQATTFDNRKIRISFQEESPRNSMSIGNPNESHSRYEEAEFLSQQPVDCAVSGGHGQGSVKSCGSVQSSPCEGLFSSGSDTGDQFVPSRLQPGTTHRRETWTRQDNWPYETREIGTQTDIVSLRQISDASTQYSPRRGGEVSTSPSIWFPSYSHPTLHKKHKQATRGQHISANELLEVDSHAGMPNLREEQLLSQSNSVQQSPRDTLTGQQLLSGRPEIPKTENWRLSPPALKTQVRDELKEEQTNGGKRLVKQVENYGHPAQHPVENMARKEGVDHITESTLMNKVTEDTAILQEIAVTLLMMKQKNK